METFGLKKLTSAHRRWLRNGNTAQFKSAPGRDTDAVNVQRRAQAMAEFLLNPRLCPLGLHIHVHADQDNNCESKRDADYDQ